MKGLKLIGGIIGFIILFLFIIHAFQSCGRIINSTTVIGTPITTRIASDEIKKLVPNAIATFSVKPPKVGVGKKVDTEIVVSADCNTCPAKYTPIYKVKSKFGFYFEPKIYVGFTQAGPTLGLAETLFRYDKYSLDGLVSFPYVSLALARNITLNSSLFLGASLPYAGFSDLKDFSVSKLFIPSLTKNVGLIGGIEFGF